VLTRIFYPILGLNSLLCLEGLRLHFPSPTRGSTAIKLWDNLLSTSSRDLFAGEMPPPSIPRSTPRDDVRGLDAPNTIATFTLNRSMLLASHPIYKPRLGPCYCDERYTKAGMEQKICEIEINQHGKCNCKALMFLGEKNDCNQDMKAFCPAKKSH
jgi:hypothetical protein